MVTGAPALSQGLWLWQALLALLAGNAFGCFLLGLTTMMGPKNGHVRDHDVA